MKKISLIQKEKKHKSSSLNLEPFQIPDEFMHQKKPKEEETLQTTYPNQITLFVLPDKFPSHIENNDKQKVLSFEPKKVNNIKPKTLINTFRSKNIKKSTSSTPQTKGNSSRFESLQNILTEFKDIDMQINNIIEDYKKIKKEIKSLQKESHEDEGNQKYKINNEKKRTENYVRTSKKVCSFFDSYFDFFHSRKKNFSQEQTIKNKNFQEAENKIKSIKDNYKNLDTQENQIILENMNVNEQIKILDNQIKEKLKDNSNEAEKVYYNNNIRKNIIGQIAALKPHFKKILILRKNPEKLQTKRKNEKVTIDKTRSEIIFNQRTNIKFNFIISQLQNQLIEQNKKENVFIQNEIAGVFNEISSNFSKTKKNECDLLFFFSKFSKNYEVTPTYLNVFTAIKSNYFFSFHILSQEKEIEYNLTPDLSNIQDINSGIKNIKEKIFGFLIVLKKKENSNNRIYLYHFDFDNPTLLTFIIKLKELMALKKKNVNDATRMFKNICLNIKSQLLIFSNQMSSINISFIKHVLCFYDLIENDFFTAENKKYLSI